MNFLWNGIKDKEHIEKIEKWMSQDYNKSNITYLARSLGLKVIYVDEIDSFSGYFERENSIIYVNNNHPITRKRFTIAHEIAHFLLGHPSAARDRSKKYDRISEEYEANSLAAEILMPIKIIAEIIGKNEGKGKSMDELLSIMSEHFQVSKTAMLIRLKICLGINSEIV